MSGLASLAGRVAVVTGGASGIGRGIARRLVEQGVTVVVADIEQQRLEATAAELGATSLPVDVADADSVAGLAEEVVGRFGRVDLVVNNAGVAPLRPVDQLSLDDFEWVMSINLGGVLHGTKAFLPHLRDNHDGGWLVNTASMAGLIAGPGMTAYALTKFGVVAFSEALAAELSGTRVGVSILIPGLVRSDIGTSERNRAGVDAARLDPAANEAYLPPGRVLEPEDVGDQVVAAVRDGELYVITHPENLPDVRRRFAAIEAAFGKPPPS